MSYHFSFAEGKSHRTVHTHFTSTSSVVGTGELQEMAAEPGAPTGSPRQSLCPLVCATVPRRPFCSDRSAAIIPRRSLHGNRSTAMVPGDRSTATAPRRWLHVDGCEGSFPYWPSWNPRWPLWTGTLTRRPAPAQKRHNLEDQHAQGN